MDYKVLYRKYRPQDFNNLYGQDNIKKILVESIINNKLAHAYLFSGPRGTGKTSTAKLFAKTINCQNPINGIPCNKCEACKNYEQSPDIIEIDAASNNGVDEIRDLRDNAKILPTFSKYKVYIIDEVHMLSQSAWNAFLKILEEPPKHIIFILATTEIQKIPITILSRCQRYNFQRISNEIIKENVLRISKQENIKITDDAAEYIALLADGGMRDALSILDQLSKEEKEITKDLIQEIFGTLTENEVKQIFNYLENKDINAINNTFNEYINKGLDVNLLISKIINYIFELEIAIINGKSSIFTTEELKQMANELINCYNKPSALTLVKIILISYLKEQKTSEIISREIKNEPPKELIKPLENKIESTKITNEKPQANSDYIDKIKKIRTNNTFINPTKIEKDKFKKSWEIFINKETLKNNIEILSLIEDINIEVVSPTYVIFSQKSKSTVVLFNQSLDIIEQEYNNILNDNKKFICLTTEEWLKIKQEFINNKNKKYEYIEEPTKEEINEVVDTAMDIFDKNIIEIN